MSKRLIEKSWTWQLSASREALWPLISDTAHLNEALGLPRYRLRETIDGEGLRRRYGEFDTSKDRVRWEEPPFEWAKDYWWRWVRLYESGALEMVRATLVMEPGKQGGTAVTYTVESEPRALLGSLLLKSGYLKEEARKLEKVLRLADAHCRKPQGDFFSNLSASRKGAHKDTPSLPPQVTGHDRTLLTQLLAWLKAAPESDLGEIRPKRVARALGISAGEAHTACLLGMLHGALERHYRLCCSHCRYTAREEVALKDIPATSGCRHCGAEVEGNLAETLEIVFKPHTATRTPLSGVTCASGPALFARTLVQQTLEPHERRDLPMSLPEGAYVARVIDAPVSLAFDMPGAGGVMVKASNDWIGDLEGAEGIVLENHGEKIATFVIEQQGWPAEATSVAEALTYDRLRETLIAEGLPMQYEGSAGEAALVVISARGENVADAAKRTAMACDGALVENTGAGYMMIFARAVAASAAIEALIKRFPDARIGADYGPLILSTTNEGPRYGGPVRDLVTDLSGLAQEGVPNLSDRFTQVMKG